MPRFSASPPEASALAAEAAAPPEEAAALAEEAASPLPEAQAKTEETASPLPEAAALAKTAASPPEAQAKAEAGCQKTMLPCSLDMFTVAGGSFTCPAVPTTTSFLRSDIS